MSRKLCVPSPGLCLITVLIVARRAGAGYRARPVYCTGARADRAIGLVLGPRSRGPGHGRVLTVNGLWSALVDHHDSSVVVTVYEGEGGREGEGAGVTSEG